MTHDEIVTAIGQMCTVRDYPWHGCNKARMCTGRGFPDLVIVTPATVLFAEVKRDHFNSRRPEQTTWAYALIAAGARYELWYERDLTSGNVGVMLDGLRQ